MTDISAPRGPVPGAGDPDVYVFEPHSVSLPHVGSYVRELWERRRFMTALARAQIKGSRESTLAGQFWAVLDPLFTALMYWVLIAILRGSSERSSASRMTLLIASVFLYSYTRVALAEGSRSVVSGKGLLLNSRFPRALLPLSTVYKGCLELSAAAVVYLVIHVLAGQPIGPGIAFLPLLFVAHTVLNVGLALLVSTLGVYVPDVANVIGYATRLLLFTTPILYPASAIPETFRAYAVWNPLYPFFSGYQAILSGGIPSSLDLVGAVLWAAVFLVVGAGVFLSHERAFSLHV